VLCGAHPFAQEHFENACHHFHDNGHAATGLGHETAHLSAGVDALKTSSQR
jgi:hypothetical protein